MLTSQQIAEVKALLALGWKQHDIAARYHENAGRVAEVKTGLVGKDIIM